MVNPKHSDNPRVTNGNNIIAMLNEKHPICFFFTTCLMHYCSLPAQTGASLGDFTDKTPVEMIMAMMTMAT